MQNPILYLCPYCKKGRFTAIDGWAGAVRHIKENHQSGEKRKGGRRRGRPPRSSSFEDFSLLEGAAVS